MRDAPAAICKIYLTDEPANDGGEIAAGKSGLTYPWGDCFVVKLTLPKAM